MSGRSAAVPVVLLASLALAACGEDGSSYSDERISDAIALEDDAVGGDPFCVVKDVLNDAGEVGEAPSGNVVASKGGNAGVVVKPPFPQDCERKVRTGLDRLDRQPKEE